MERCDRQIDKRQAHQLHPAVAIPVALFALRLSTRLNLDRLPQIICI